jgi:hypothetical protein
MFRVGQNRIYAPYMTLYLVISLPRIPYIHRIYMAPANPPHISSVSRIQSYFSLCKFHVPIMASCCMFRACQNHTYKRCMYIQCICGIVSKKMRYCKQREITMQCKQRGITMQCKQREITMQCKQRGMWYSKQR